MNAGLPLYTAHNLWYEHPDRVFAINYKKGTLIPAGTPVLPDPRGPHGTAFRFSVPATGVAVTVHLQPKFAPGVTVEALAARTLGPAPWEALVAGLDQREIDAIRAGIVPVGMSRRAVIVAWGYPPEHATPSLEAPVWSYWVNRFIKKELRFGPDGRTATALP